MFGFPHWGRMGTGRCRKRQTMWVRNTFDVAVVGGGIAGVSVAAALAAEVSVVLLERETQLAQHTTGRSAALYSQTYESPAVQALTRDSWDGFVAASAEAEVEILVPRPTLWVAAKENTTGLIDMAEASDALVPVSGDGARGYCSALRDDWVAAGAFEDAACDIDVLALHQHYVRVGRAHGMEIQTGVPLLSARQRGGTWTIDVGGDELQAGMIVNASGSWTDKVAVACGITPLGMAPLRRTAVVARPSGCEVDPEWPFVIDFGGDFYFRPEGPHIFCSPEDETLSEPCDARPEELDVAMTLDRVNAVTTLGLRSVVRAWAGLRTYSPDRLPVIGRDAAEDSFLWCAGQGGFGIMTAPAISALCAALALGNGAHDAEFADQFSPARF